MVLKSPEATLRLNIKHTTNKVTKSIGEMLRQSVGCVQSCLQTQNNVVTNADELGEHETSGRPQCLQQQGVSTYRFFPSFDYHLTISSDFNVVSSSYTCLITSFIIKVITNNTVSRCHPLPFAFCGRMEICVYPTQFTSLDRPSGTHCESSIQKMTQLPAQTVRGRKPVSTFIFQMGATSLTD